MRTKADMEYLYQRAKRGAWEDVDIFVHELMIITDHMANKAGSRKYVVSERLRDEREAYIRRSLNSQITYATYAQFFEPIERYMRQERVKVILTCSNN